MTSPGDGTFTVGVATLDNAYKHANYRTLKIADRDGKFDDIATFIVNCIINDEDGPNKSSKLLKALKNALDNA